MKKVKLIYIVFLLFLVSCSHRDTINRQFSTFVLTSNESGIFTDALNNIDLKTYNVATPFPEDIVDCLTQIDEVEVYPYYPLRIEPVNGKEFTTIFIRYGTNTKSIQIPSDQGVFGNASINTIGSVRIEPYMNEDDFKSQNFISKRFNCNSGIYISERLFDLLNLNESESKLEITVVVLCPLTIKQETVFVNYNGNDLYQNWYNTDRYGSVEYTFEIEGIIDGSSTSIIDGIAIPYDVSEQIYSQIIQDASYRYDEIPWKPNSWIVISHEQITRDEIARIIKKFLSNFVIGDYYTTNLFERTLYE